MSERANYSELVLGLMVRAINAILELPPELQDTRYVGHLSAVVEEHRHSWHPLGDAAANVVVKLWGTR